MPYQLLAAGPHARDILSEQKKCFYKEHCNVTLETFLATKFGLWIDTPSSIGNTMAVAEQLEKVAKSSDSDLMCHVFSLEDAVAHLTVSDLIRILTIEK